ncbi:MAG TPA: MFS transporter [Burkholderiales bacterium]|nr:MFS transporter [Burkholderiales bacterium]
MTSMPSKPPADARWVVFALGAAAFLLSFFHRVAPAAIAEELTRAFDVSGAALGALAAAYFYIYTVMQLPTGVLADTLGPRRVLTAGGVVAGIGSIVFGGADSVALAAAGRTLVGLGVSVAFICLLKLNANWFAERQFATAVGLSNIFGMSGALLATAPLAWLITFASWRTVFVAVGIVSLALAATTWGRVRDYPADRAPDVSVTPIGERWHHGLAEVLRNRASWPGFWVNFGLSGSYMSFIGLWAVPFLVHAYGMSPLAASRHTGVMLIVFAFSAVGIGMLSDRIGRRRPLLVASSFLYFVCWMLWISGAGAAPGMTYAIFMLMGFSATGFTLSWTCAKEANRPRYSGMATSLANTGGFLAAGILQPLVGWVLDRSAEDGPARSALEAFRPGLAVLAAFAFTGFIGALFIRETHCRNIWSDGNHQEEK